MGSYWIYLIERFFFSLLSTPPPTKVFDTISTKSSIPTAIPRKFVQNY